LEIARDFIRVCLTVDQRLRPKAEQLLAHPWLATTVDEHDPASPVGEMRDLLPNMKRQFDAKKVRLFASSFTQELEADFGRYKTFRKAAWSVRWINATKKAAELTTEEKLLRDQVDTAKDEAEKVKNPSSSVEVPIRRLMNKFRLHRIGRAA
jgi:serine/threonine protein kinase